MISVQLNKSSQSEYACATTTTIIMSTQEAPFRYPPVTNTFSLSLLLLPLISFVVLY